MALKGINAYKKDSLKQDIASADPHRLTLMLMQGSLDRMAYAKGCMERKDFAGKAEHLSRVNAILLNLRDTLDLDVGGDVAQNLHSLYDYMIARLLDANIQNSLQILDEVISLLLPITKAWASIPEDVKEEAHDIQRRKSHSE